MARRCIPRQDPRSTRPPPLRAFVLSRRESPPWTRCAPRRSACAFDRGRAGLARSKPLPAARPARRTRRRSRSDCAASRPPLRPPSALRWLRGSVSRPGDAPPRRRSVAARCVLDSRSSDARPRLGRRPEESPPAGWPLERSAATADRRSRDPASPGRPPRRSGRVAAARRVATPAPRRTGPPSRSETAGARRVTSRTGAARPRRPTWTAWRGTLLRSLLPGRKRSWPRRPARRAPPSSSRRSGTGRVMRGRVEVRQ